MEAEGYKGALKAVRANQDHRYAVMDQYQRYVDGTQYRGRSHWLDVSDVPLLERAPSVNDKIVKKAITSHKALLLGSRQFPSVVAGMGEDDQPFHPRFGLSDDDRTVLLRAIDRASDQCKLRRQARLAYVNALKCGSACTALSVRRGKLHAEHLDAKNTRPEFDEEGELVFIESRYPFMEYFRGEDGKKHVRAMIYRRVIDRFTDTTFKPVPADENGGEPDIWVTDRVIRHDYGFVPAVWYAHDSDDDGIDGKPIHQNLLDEIDAYNRSLSQHDRAALYAGDPQIVEIGVDADHNPAPAGRRHEPMKSYPNEDPAASRGHKNWGVGGVSIGNVRKKGPGTIWRYPAADGRTEVKQLVLAGDALESIDSNRRTLQGILAESMHWVRVDQGGTSGVGGSRMNVSALSGRALMWLYRRQLAFLDDERLDFGDGWLLPFVEVVLRVSAAHAAGGGLYLAGLPELALVLARFSVETVVDEAAQTPVTEVRWVSPHLRVEWGQYFEDSPDDQGKEGEQVRKDHEAGIIRRDTALRKRSDYYGIDDVEAYLEAENKPSGPRAPVQPGGGLEGALSKLEEMESVEAAAE